MRPGSRGPSAVLCDAVENCPEIPAPFLATLDQWHIGVGEVRATWPDTEELRNVPGINPNIFMHQLARRSGKASAYVVDVGQHQMWAAQSLELNTGQRFLTSGGMGLDGIRFARRHWAALATPGRPVVMIAGDGGFQCNIQELQTVHQLNLPIKMVIINNACHGMVRQFQETILSNSATNLRIGVIPHRNFGSGAERRDRGYRHQGRRRGRCRTRRSVGGSDDATPARSQS